MQPSDTPAQFHTFKDCLARLIVTRSPSDDDDNGSDLHEFTSFLASEVWLSFPPARRDAAYDTRDASPDPETISLANIPPSFIDSLISYALCTDWDDAQSFLRKALAEYLSEACAPPPVWSATRTKECELCEREVPLTYHHLIPRSTHPKVLKRRWHPESVLNAVAWLCRPCHTAVHRAATNEALAREFYTVQLLLQREDINPTQFSAYFLQFISRLARLRARWHCSWK